MYHYKYIMMTSEPAGAIGTLFSTLLGYLVYLLGKLFGY